MFKGAFTALITPMRGGEVDFKGLKDLVEFQITQGIDGLVPCGTTGETATLTKEEYLKVIKTTVEQTKKRVPVIAGAGANNTLVAIENSKMAMEAGADALLHVTPFYNKPTPTGLLAHFKAVAEAAKAPIILYNVPGRTGCDMLPDTVAKALAIPHVVGIKEATGSIARGELVIMGAPKAASILSGDDATSVAHTLMGGHGVISVASNIIPGPMAKMIKAALDGKVVEARELHYKYQILMDLLFIESNPIPVKAACALLGYGANDVRLPLAPLPEEKVATLRAEMKRVGVLS